MIIGSNALFYHYPWEIRIPKDFDVIGDHSYPLEEKIERHKNPYVKYFSTPKIGAYINPSDLLTLKMSHLFWDINWNKHMWDVQFLLTKDNIPNENLFYNLYIYFCTIHGTPKRSELKMSYDKFTDNVIVNGKLHDKLHWELSEYLYNKSPVFIDILKDNEEVDVCKNKFYKLSFENQIRVVQEEIMVMTLERKLTNFCQQDYDVMLKKFIMNHAPIWQSFFIIKNYLIIRKFPEKFKQIHGSYRENKRKFL
jgi:hypothetical protein